MYHLLKKNDLPLDIAIHSDPLCILPAALSKNRAFKVNKIVQAVMDDPDGVRKCRLCNPDLLVGKPSLTLHEKDRVISFPNAAPFLPGDQRVFALWHSSQKLRYRHAHKVKFSDFGIEEFYYLTRAAVDHAVQFPKSKQGLILREDTHLTRAVAGFNIGRFAGQSLPHFHLQYGWEFVLQPKNITRAMLNLYYEEMRCANLILHEDKEMYVLIPWTPKGQHHVEIHFKNKHHFTSLKGEALCRVAYFVHTVLGLYKKVGIQNVNILFTGSPEDRNLEPLRIQLVPRANVTAFYEMIGINVIDTQLEESIAFFKTGIRWSDIAKEASQFDPSLLYKNRFQ